MRLSDAIAELDGVEGLQVHRSWWVARDAVDEVKRDGRNLRLRLSNGVEAPVSRNRANDLKSAGWL
jgi:DNA-binding LytR/AlgR family response regulator